MFENPIDLHYSQTMIIMLFFLPLFENPIDLHYSQTIRPQTTPNV